jgi:predicted O-methyltransferase YrrM
MTLDLYLKYKNCIITEGYTQPVSEQVEILKDLVNNNKIINILEIGFNAGHSSCLFLESNRNCKVYSFDIGCHDYLQIGKQYINHTFPNRHELILGDSKITIPTYINNNKDMKMDLIFIDGGHDFETAITDLINCKMLSHQDTILIMDDTIINSDANIADWNKGPTEAWLKLKSCNLIQEKESFVFSFGRGMSVGKYSFFT